MESPNSYNEDLKPCVILRLPNELLLEIVKYIDGCSLVAFSQTCTQLSTACHGIRCLNFDNSDGQSLGKSLSQLNSFFKRRISPSLLTNCNFSGCYWIPSSILQPFLTRCVNLKGLYLTETSLSIKQIAINILPKCTQLASLSFSMKHSDWNSHLLDDLNLVEVLKKLTSVEMILSQNCTIFEAVDFLQYCENLENLMVIISLGRVGNSPGQYHRGTPSFSKLKSLIFIVDPVSLDGYQFYDVKSTCELSTIWSNFLDIDCLHNHHHQFKSVGWDVPLFLRLNYPSIAAGNSHIIPQNVISVESVWEPIPLLMHSIAPKLKLANCYYDNQVFERFARNHPLIEVLKLRAHPTAIEKASPDSWTVDSWKNLSKLRVLSIEPIIIEGLRNEVSKKMKLDSNGQSVEILPLMAAVLQSCPLIQEIELASFDNHRIRLSVEELSAISQCVNLKKLTLTNLSIMDGLFLEQILKKCTHLESLRLKDLDPSASCRYAANLCAALPSARKLKTFCLFQRDVPLIPELFQSLESCGSLSRVSLVCPSGSAAWNEKLTAEEFAAYLNQFCTKLSHLVALFCVLTVPETYCHAANTLLKENLKEDRPSFRADVQSCGNDYLMQITDGFRSVVLPLIHRDIMTRFQSHVANLPFHCKSLLFH